MEEFLAALLSREALADGVTTCRHCDKSSLPVWRCKDCTFSSPMCRSCMRHSHRDNPFHRIEHWNGSYFRPAELWEVGTYLLVRHHDGEEICDNLRVWCKFLEEGEEPKDASEQKQLRESALPMPMMSPIVDFDEMDMEDEGRTGVGEEDFDDEEFDENEELEEEPEIFNPYLDATSVPSSSANAGTSANAGASGNSGRTANAGSGSGPRTGTYVRVVHSNGIHHIGMVSCHCRGDDNLPLDLFAARLIPASLKRIKTLFSAQVLDMYRLSNLELKASAYQFYQLLRRLTRPMAPAEVEDLYREFRRMSRIWRWMKKLKWAGYADSTKSVHDVGSGDLAIYCPACPQPGINLPDNWKDDPARHVIYSLSAFFDLWFNRWVYKRMFVADGNFKADHVRQTKEAGDIWLSEGSSMIPDRQEYLSFLASAIERLTVSATLPAFPYIFHGPSTFISGMVQLVLITVNAE
jgi:hypothetical protein